MMRISRLMESFIMSFDNGWTVDITPLVCDHYEVAVLPSRFREDHDTTMKEIVANKDHWQNSAMIARGDLIEHFNKSDSELLDFIIAVRARPMEPHLAAINDQIRAAVKSS